MVEDPMRQALIWIAVLQLVLAIGLVIMVIVYWRRLGRLRAEARAERKEAMVLGNGWKLFSAALQWAVLNGRYPQVADLDALIINGGLRLVNPYMGKEQTTVQPGGHSCALPCEVYYQPFFEPVELEGKRWVSSFTVDGHLEIGVRCFYQISDRHFPKVEPELGGVQEAPTI